MAAPSASSPIVTEELVEQGHDVTLFASGDSLTPPRARAVHAPRRCGSTHDQGPAPLSSDDARRGAPARLDDSTCCTSTSTCLHYPVIRDFCLAHGDDPARPARSRRTCIRSTAPSATAPLVSISDNQRKPMPPVNWAGTHPSRPAAEPAEAARRAPRRLPRLPRPHLAREAARPRHRDRRRAAGASCASPPRSTRSTATTGARRSSR